MSGGFAFPPPPPPPPKASNPANNQRGGGYQQNEGFQNRGRGRGGPRGGYSQRGWVPPHGRGNFAPAGHQQQSSNGPYGKSQQSTQQNRHVTGHYPQYNQHQQPAQTLPPGAFVNPNFSTQGSGSSASFGSVQQNANPQQLNNNGSGGYAASKATSPLRTTAGHKRKLEALRGPQQERPKKPGPQTAPAVPIFGAPIVVAQPQLPTNVIGRSQTNDQKKKPALRGLGLTPSDNNTREAYSDSEDEKEVDEEAMYAELGNKLTFEHNGVVMSLKSQADLAAWKKERQRNWPTRARMTEKDEERRRIGQERKRLLATAGSLHPSPQHGVSKLEGRRDGGSFGGKLPDMVNGPNKGPQGSESSVAQAENLSELDRAKAELTEQTKKLEALRKRVAQSEAKNRRAKSQKDRDDSVATSFEVQVQDTGMQEDSVVDGTENPLDLRAPAEEAHQNASDVSDETSEESSSDVSSDSTADSDSDDDAPEEVASKPPAAATPVSQKPLCRHFAASGYCRDGDVCRFKHERQSETLVAQEQRPRPQHMEPQITRTSRPPALQQSSEKKSIFQRLVEQEQNEEDRLALQVIKYLGKLGFFEESAPTQEP